FVSLAVQEKWCASRDQAVLLGQFLLDEGYISTCTVRRDGSEQFEDAWSLYRFRVADQQNLFADFSAGEKKTLLEGNGRRSFAHSWLHVPVSVFAIPLATAGLANVWFGMSALWPDAGLQYVGFTYLIICVVLWTFFFLLYCLKIVFRW